MRWSVRGLAAVALLTGTTAALPAQGSPPKFGCTEAEHRQFDFWIGDWNVTVKGKQAGTNLVTLEEQGCVIHEHWVGSRGGTGQSFNFYDQGEKQWHQVWVDNQGTYVSLTGHWSDGHLVFTGTAPGPQGQPLAQRRTFTPNADGTVRQFWETSADQGKSWQVAFDGTYTKK